MNAANDADRACPAAPVAEADLMVRIVRVALARVPEGLVAAPARIALDRLHQLAVGEAPVKPLAGPGRGASPLRGGAPCNATDAASEISSDIAEQAFVEAAARAVGLPRSRTSSSVAMRANR